MTAQMRSGPAARDPEFRGIDPPALDRVIRQLQDAQNAIQGWLNGHRPPPGVPATGYRQADQVALWAADQLGMLTRRYNYAITHPDGGGVDVPPVRAPSPKPSPGGNPGAGGGVQPGRPGATAPRTPSPGTPGTPGRRHPVRPPRHTAPPTSRGAGDLGNFPTRQAAARAARADALAVAAAVRDGDPVPDGVWKHLRANADDPDYTEALYERLGPASAAALVKAAHGDAARLEALRQSLGTSSHHLAMDAAWLRAFLAEADREGVRPVAVQVLTGADLSPRARDALAGLHQKAGG
ncbi:hypothetical protein [Actinomadura sp. NEAU-AAG7]|uniref:hypothetical protein n=1 Tax=Actinomadura sp. NEAU-AAG7 TaxID=2839640 RepID=UPI001BE47B7D|nr:hypothetical protein [Actinomadura sp. NEAU-AAG7]MBT2209713.1 hypothetical protein [Actinomadura sp. NEAU-AAG7]